MTERKRKAKTGALRTEVFAMRLDPKLKYLAEIAARKQRRSLANFIEWAIEQGLENVNISRSGNNTLSVTDEAEKLWALDEPERLINLASNYPDLLTYDEQLFYRVIQEYVINDEKSRSTIDFLVNKGDPDNALKLHMIRKCWTEIKAFALDSGVEDELKAAMRNYDGYSY
ncbi:MAG: hypothetical protein E2O81_05355 [Betaproteobacteria bacterium]|nr:MAG: hypothetical protein E2O81_05355 [Betaproteobacteria bacterium]